MVSGDIAYVFDVSIVSGDIAFGILVPGDAVSCIDVSIAITIVLGD